MLTIFKSIGSGIVIAVVVGTAACGVVPRAIGNEVTRDTVVTYRYDTEAKKWSSDAGMPSSGDGSVPFGSRTLIVQMQPDTPVREIIIDEGLAVGGAAPIFEIDGDPGDSGGGAIRIGTLTMDTVDARRLEIRDTQVVSSNLTNVVAQDNELTLDIETVPVVFVERGTSSILSLKSFRVDRIRILGVGGGVDSHLERLTVTRSSFVGKILIEDAKIQSLFLIDVSLDE